MREISVEETLKKTPLYDRHVALNGKIVDFSGWALPVYYSGIISEHKWVRESCGFFDVSHLGEVRVTGPKALSFLQHRFTNDVRKCQNGRMLYTLLCNEQGKTLDDILIYKESDEDFYLIVNASNIERDVQEMQKFASEGVAIDNVSEEMACIAVQGPKSATVVEKLFGFHVKDMPYYSFKAEKFSGESVWISRSGYTGEDGFEIFSQNKLSPSVWDVLAVQGKKEGALPAGLGARNTLRLEAGNPLYGHELTEDTTPLEAGLGFTVSWEKGDFVGREALLRQKQSGVAKRLVGFKMSDRQVARDGYPVFKDGKNIGHVTSGSFAPTVGGNIGMAYVAAGQEKTGNILEIEIHGVLAKAEIVKRPFVGLKHKK